MKVIDTEIADVKIIEPKVFGDDRGFFLETYQDKRYRELLDIDQSFVQDNCSRSTRGTLRGLHFQREKAQGKLVRVTRGKVFDVAVDIRPDSPTFRHWVGWILSDENHCQVWIPPGLAHGFQVISKEADLEYKCTEYYYPQDEGCLMWNDHELNIDWPIKPPLLSTKDQNGYSFQELFVHDRA